MSETPHKHSGINPDFSVNVRKANTSAYYIEGLKDKNRFILSECITLIESKNISKRKLADAVLSDLPESQAQTIRIGITGSPGVGKSTFIESFGLHLIGHNHRPAILAIDPSSQANKGSILGDKTRMNELSSHEDAYIRPSPSGAVLGGTAAHTKDAILLCEAAGFDIILVETVGVGQSETEVDNITDVNILLLQPGAGDDIQGIKRGIVENADIFVINKADGTQYELARLSRSSYKNALQLFHHDISGWTCPVILTSSIQKIGLDEVYKSVLEYVVLLKENNQFISRRQLQEFKWFEKQSMLKLKEIVFNNAEVQSNFASISAELISGKIKTTAAIHKMEDTFRNLINL